VLSHHAGSLNDQGQIYLMPDRMTGLDTVTLNSEKENCRHWTTEMTQAECTDTLTDDWRQCVPSSPCHKLRTSFNNQSHKVTLLFL